MGEQSAVIVDSGKGAADAPAPANIAAPCLAVTHCCCRPCLPQVCVKVLGKGDKLVEPDTGRAMGVLLQQMQVLGDVGWVGWGWGGWGEGAWGAVCSHSCAAAQSLEWDAPCAYAVSPHGQPIRSMEGAKPIVLIPLFPPALAAGGAAGGGV